MDWTGHPEADALVARDPLALLIGFCLDQQIPVEKAFFGPLEMQRRLGTLDARELAAIDPGRFEAAFRERPAIHRFPASMAARVQALCAVVGGGLRERRRRDLEGRHGRRRAAAPPARAPRLRRDEGAHRPRRARSSTSV